MHPRKRHTSWLPDVQVADSEEDQDEQEIAIAALLGLNGRQPPTTSRQTPSFKAEGPRTTATLGDGAGGGEQPSSSTCGSRSMQSPAQGA